MREVAVEPRERRRSGDPREVDAASDRGHGRDPGIARERGAHVELVLGRGERRVHETVHVRRQLATPRRRRELAAYRALAGERLDRVERGTATGRARCSGGGHRAESRARARRSCSRARRGARAGRRRAGRTASPTPRSSAPRSASAMSGSSRGGAGNTPSASPHTHSRSSSTPSVSAAEPTSRPSPSRPTRSRAASSSSPSDRRNTSNVGRASTASRPAKPVDRGLDPARGFLLERRPRRAPLVAADPAPDEPVHPQRELRPRRRRLREIGGQLGDEPAQPAHPLAPPGRPGGSVVVAFGVGIARQRRLVVVEPRLPLARRRRPLRHRATPAPTPTACAL